MIECRRILRTFLGLGVALLVPVSGFGSSGPSMGSGCSWPTPGGGSGSSSTSTPMVPAMTPVLPVPSMYTPPTHIGNWLPLPPGDCPSGYVPKKPKIRPIIPLIGVAGVTSLILKDRRPAPPPVVQPPVVHLPPAPAIGPQVHRAAELGKKAASSVARHAGSVARRAAAGAAVGAGLIGSKLAELRERRREPPPEPPRAVKKPRKKSAPKPPPVPPAAKLDPRLRDIPEEQMVMVMIRGEPRGLSADASRGALAGVSVAAGNERSHLLRVEATQNLSRVLESLRQEQIAHPGDIPGYELNWLLNGVVVMARAKVARKLAALGDVNYVMLDAPLKLATPKTRKVAPAGQTSWGLTKINALRAWKDQGAYGEGVTIGLIDTGADGQHKDLAGRIVRFRDFTKPGGPEEPAYDDEGHGTHCAGIIAGGGAQGSPIGVAPRAQLLVAKALDKDGAGTISGLVQALQWMADPDGNPATRDQPTAVSISWGSDPGLPVANTIFWDAISSLRAAGVLPIVASGNSGPDKVAIPGAYPHIYAVGATDAADQVADITSRGNVTWQGVAYSKPNISAPGDEVYSATPGNTYEWMTGTSQAAPHVAGVAALMKSVNPALTATQIEEIINQSSSDLGAPGLDATFGNGRIDALAAVAAARKLVAAQSATKAP